MVYAASVRAVLALVLLAPLGLASAATAAPTRIAFTAGDGIDVMNADGSARAPLLKVRRGLFAAQPAWSPDGKRIAYVAGGEESGRSRVWTMAADGSDRHPLGPPREANTFEQTPAWSASGRSIAFSRTTFAQDSITTSLMISDAEGGEPRTVVTEHAKRLLFISAPAWSPDGSRLLYTRTVLRNDSYFRSALFSASGSDGQHSLVARDASGGSFSPDGSMIAFSSTRDRHGYTCGSDECSYNGEIYVAAADGSGARRLTTSKADDASPAWSPDGARIAFHSDRNYPVARSPEIYSIAVDGTCLTWLTNGTPSSSGPAWEPGAGGSSDPGGCGATPRSPYFGIDLAPARTFAAATPYWIGPQTSTHLLLSQVISDRHSVGFVYDDCSRYRPRECRGLLQIYIDPVCRRRGDLYRELAASRPQIFKGGLLLRPGRDGGGTVLVASDTHVDIQAGDIPVRSVVRKLRKVDERGPAASFPRAKLPGSFWTRTERVEDAFREHGGDLAATARALHMRRDRVSDALDVASALRRFGPFDRLDC